MKDKWRQVCERGSICVRGKNVAGRVGIAVFFWSMAGLLAASSRDSVNKLMGRMDGGVQEVNQITMNPDTDRQLNMGLEEVLEQAATMAVDSVSEADQNREYGSPVQDSGMQAEYDAAIQEEAPAEPEQKRVALTFDDGPHPVYTEMLLDGLAERGIHATFFVIGKNIEGNEELLARMDAEGHLIGNHTYDHVKICDMSGEDACEQVEKTSSLVREITGKDTDFVRPPFGAWNQEMESSFHMIPVMWDVDPLDWTTKNTELVVERVLENVQSEDIILLHDYYESSVEAALRIVDELQAQGYEFVTADELILE